MAAKSAFGKMLFGKKRCPKNDLTVVQNFGVVRHAVVVVVVAGFLLIILPFGGRMNQG